MQRLVHILKYRRKKESHLGTTSGYWMATLFYAVVGLENAVDNVTWRQGTIRSLKHSRHTQKGSKEDWAIVNLMKLWKTGKLISSYYHDSVLATNYKLLAYSWFLVISSTHKLQFLAMYDQKKVSLILHSF